VTEGFKHVITLSPRTQKWIALAIVLAIAVAIARLLPPFNSVHTEFSGLAGIIVAMAAATVVGIALRGLNNVHRVIPWAYHSCNVGGMLPTWWVVSLLAPSLITISGPIWATCLLYFCALLVVDFVNDRLTRHTHWL
jgi:hypothetical protein